MIVVFTYVSAFTSHALGGYRVYILPFYNTAYAGYLYVIQLGVDTLIDMSRRLP